MILRLSGQVPRGTSEEENRSPEAFPAAGITSHRRDAGASTPPLHDSPAPVVRLRQDVEEEEGYRGIEDHV